MAKLLKGLGWASIILAIIIGIFQANRTDDTLEQLLGSDYEAAFRWSIAIYWWISGIISGIVFYALGLILEHVESTSIRLSNLERGVTPSSAPKLGNSKASMDKLSGFKI
ncbi:hypothetical protein [Cohnella yongneupensis]|uniref:Uncharacterized protein n=1 Tax=Cohnella yongneupensis TaxID=425006 RepID=A0ABW0QZT4_9BACL